MNSQITTLDLCMNNLNLGLEQLVSAVKKSDHIICLKLRNNNVDGRKHQQVLYDLLLNNCSLTSLDLGNSDNIKNRNRIYNEGLKAMIQAIVDSRESSLMSEFYLQSACITGRGLREFHSLNDVAVDIQVLDLANNDLGNDFLMSLKPVLKTLVSLNLSNTKLGLRGCTDLAQCLMCSGEAGGYNIKYLDLSQN